MCQPRLFRCLRLLTLLQSRIGYSAKDLACQCEVSKRTIYRDLFVLAECGVPVCNDAQRGGYVLQSHSKFCVSGLSSDELASLLLAAHIFSLSCDHEIGRPIHQAIGKLLSQTSAVVQEEVAYLLKSVGGEFATTLWPRESQPVVVEILTALRKKGHVRIVYQPSEESAPPLQIHTKVKPYRLVAAQGNWYLVGRSSWHRKICRFDLRHIQRARRLESTCEPVKSPLVHARTGS